MSRLQACFERLSADSRKALIPYVMTADPAPEVTLPLMHAMVEAGADIIELGAPFSDPMADGPVIQAAAERSLAFHTSLHSVFETARQFRQTDAQTPIVLMGYLNPVEVMGYEAFARQAAENGIDGIITVDMPPEESDEYVAARLALNRKHIDLPLGVGFGISNAETAASVSRCADAVIVGSAIVNKMAAQKDNKSEQTATIARDVTALLQSMRVAMDSNRTKV
jgi:tryptophan synthase alpha chain